LNCLEKHFHHFLLDLPNLLSRCFRLVLV